MWVFRQEIKAVNYTELQFNVTKHISQDSKSLINQLKLYFLRPFCYGPPIVRPFHV
jgi:hypothetical protein